MHDEREVAALTDDFAFHTWTFTLSDSGSVSIRTDKAVATEEEEEVDTKLYLYRMQDNGRWGRNIKNNDNATGVDTLFSAIDRNLEAGDYRLLVKGKEIATRGAFSVRVDCIAGPGCVDDEICDAYGSSIDDCVGTEGLPMQICVEDYGIRRELLSGCCERETRDTYLFCPLPEEVDRGALETCLAHAEQIIDCELADQDVAQCAADSELFSIEDLQQCCGYDNDFYFCDSIEA